MNFNDPDSFALNSELKELWEQDIMNKLGLKIPYHIEMDVSQDERIAREFNEGL
ncbi:MAG: hypothetical protein LLF94_04475 [Chlamydiales bacterium]|nr:hypothetical protein [Chlamydiales bacterium]